MEALADFSFYTGGGGSTTAREERADGLPELRRPLPLLPRLGLQHGRQLDGLLPLQLLQGPRHITNVEHLDSYCVDDIHAKTSHRPFLVASPLGWLEDK